MSDYTPEHRAGDAPADYQEEQPVIGDAPPKANVVLSNAAYDKLKFVAQVLLPGLGALYFGLAAIWGLPAAEQVVGTITVVDTFLGLFLVAGTRQYTNSDARFDGHIQVAPDQVEGITNLNVSLDPDAVSTKREIVVKIDRA